MSRPQYEGWEDASQDTPDQGRVAIYPGLRRERNVAADTRDVCGLIAFAKRVQGAVEAIMLASERFHA